MIEKNLLYKGIIICLLILASVFKAYSQTTYNQITNEFQFNRMLNDKWAGELNIGSAFSNTPSENRILKTNIQRFPRIWAHYYVSPRWKLSAFAALFRNKDVPDIGQYKSLEYRFGVQGNYYFHKIGYTLSTRMRGELRFIGQEDGNYDDVFRYNQQVKYLKPINSKFLRKGVFYVFVSDEILFRSQTKSTGLTHFDRNIFTLSGGYLITDDIQIELGYANEYIPRDDDGDIMNNVYSFTFMFNNLLPNLKKKLFAPSQEKIIED